MAAIIFINTAGYMIIEEVDFTPALYMTILSVTTVGYREVFPLSTGGIFFTIWVILSGIGVFFYITVSIAEYIFEGRVRKILGRRRMKKFSELKNHVVIAGFGRMGEYVCRELAEKKIKFVVIENNPERFAIAEERNYNVLLNDATEDEALKLAGVRRAKTFISLLSSDADNIFTVLSTREFNPGIFIISRALEFGNEKKLCKIGANRVILPYELSSRRIVHTVLKPNVVEFLDTVTYSSPEIFLSIEEYTIREDSPLAGKEIKDTGLREEFNAMVVAIKRTKGVIFSPSSHEKIEVGDILILVGEKAKILGID
ncbi:MAG: potassium channel protein [Candidatus Aminicenantes bacterium]|nr:potassium channel protein [Candidatus Aminicenantes bacterium]